jgi:hypothetical protein
MRTIPRERWTLEDLVYIMRLAQRGQKLASVISVRELYES